MHDKMHVRPFWFVNDEGTVECAVISHTVAFLYVFRDKMLVMALLSNHISP